MSAPLLEIEKLVKRYALPRESLFRGPAELTALAGVSLAVTAGRSLGIVGESGSGKSTLARIAMALEKPSSGAARFEGRDFTTLGRSELKRLRRDFQMVFQDPYGSLDPRRKVEWIVAEPLSMQDASRGEMREAVAEALASVGLRPADAAKYPHEFSGGQRQRIAIARALITKPRLIVADEPVSALDVSVQAQVLNLLQDLQRDFGVTFLLISHDLAVVDHVCDAVAVMYRGRIVEEGAPDALFRAAAHPYTRALIAAMPKPVPGRKRERVKGDGGVPSGIAAQPGKAASPGCPYAERCPHAQARCLAEAPALRPLGEGRSAACHFAETVMALPRAD
ncbi:MAG: ABC transporter ATP-binding protein [Hyphomicrobiales bacterium]